MNNREEYSSLYSEELDDEMNISEIKNSINASLIHNLTDNIEENNKTSNFYKYLAIILFILTILLLGVIVVFIIYKKQI